MITDADRARICEAMGNGWACLSAATPYRDKSATILLQGHTERTEAEFVLAVHAWLCVSFIVTMTGTEGFHYVTVKEGITGKEVLTRNAEELKEAILLAALAVLNAKGAA